jgi:hypothetical protein
MDSMSALRLSRTGPLNRMSRRYLADNTSSFKDAIMRATLENGIYFSIAG